MHDALLVPTILAPSSHSACSLSSRSASGAMIHARTIAVRAIPESETSNLLTSFTVRLPIYAAAGTCGEADHTQPSSSPEAAVAAISAGLVTAPPRQVRV